jgi:hypothetical protein
VVVVRVSRYDEVDVEAAKTFLFAAVRLPRSSPSSSVAHFSVRSLPPYVYCE